MPKDAAEKLNRLDEFNQAQITGKAERVKKNQQRGQSLQLVESQRERVWPGQNRTADTRIFSPLIVARLCVTIGHYLYLSKRLTPLPAGRFYRFEHIVAYSSGKVVAK